jgi:hypothetical protein
VKLAFLSRLLAPLVGPALAFFKKASLKRAAASGETVTPSPISEIDRETLVHLGAEEVSGWKTISDLITRRIVQSEAFTLPHVRSWLSSADTQTRLKRLSHARIAAAPELSEDHEALVTSYMLESGEHRHLAEDLIDLTVKVFVAAVFGGVKDDSLSAQLQISVSALQQRFDRLHHQIESQDLPEPGWSLATACRANSDWLLSTFSSRARAKVNLGQKLSPADPAGATEAVFRDDLVEQLGALLVDLPLGGVLALTGDEGNGKSWLAAQSWLSWTVKPLTIFLAAEDIQAGTLDPIKLLSLKLSEQTDRHGFERHQAFWSQKLLTWRTEGQSPVQGMIVIVDGLNQRPRTEWARVIDQLSGEVQRIGGKIILTSRKRYFDSSVKPGLVSPCRELSIPEWTPAERDKLLAVRGISSNNLNEQVALSLCNPRLLNVALTLLDSTQLKAMNELSVPLLLFEHIRASQDDSYRQPVENFTRTLRDHAKEVLQRLSAKQVDDLNVFDGGIDAVVEGRFFVPLADDLTRYTVQKDGLDLAMGFAILAELHKALRNGRDLTEALALITEPIAALDQTSDAVFAALTVACMSETFSVEVGAAIVVSFAGLQNLDERTFDSVAALARNRPQAFLSAAEMLALEGASAVNYDWVELALHQAKTDVDSQQLIQTNVYRWLAYTTIEIDQHFAAFHVSENEIADRLLNSQKELNLKIASLSDSEQKIFLSLSQKPVRDLSPLGRLAIGLLAGMSLAPFARAFLQWSFATSLNGNHRAPVKLFRELIRFNGRDWEATRAALLHLTQELDTEKLSPVGQRAMTTVLQATGHPNDAHRAQELIKLLTKDWPRHTGKSRLERYCTGEPCDPALSEPDNAAYSAGDYAAIDVAKLSLQMGTDLNDQAFDDARPCVARFYPNIAIDKHRELIDNILGRMGLPLRQGIHLLLPHSSLIKEEQAKKLAYNTYDRGGGTTKLQSLGHEEQTWGLFQLELAFPQLDAISQLENLLATGYGNNISYQLMEMIKPLDVREFDARLTQAALESDSDIIFTVLLFSPFIEQAFSEATLTLIPNLLNHGSAFVRAHTWKMIARSNDPKAIFSALKLHRNKLVGFSWEHRLERWHRSELMLAAAEQKLVPWEQLASEIDYSHLGRFSAICEEAVSYCASVVDILMQRLLSLPIDLGSLEINVDQCLGALSRPQSFSLRERQQPPANQDEAFRRVFEEADDFDERQKNLHAAFESILSSIDCVDARDLLDQLAIGDLEAIISKVPTFATKWSALLLTQPIDTNLTAVRNMALLLAHDIAKFDPITAVLLFEKYEPIRPIVRINFGNAGIEHGAMIIWSANDSPAVDAVRRRRLDLAANNDDLAKEVWAALWNRKFEQLKCYIDQCITSRWPAKQARGILVAGFMNENEFSEVVLDNFEKTPGLLGETQRFAYDVYKRHVWTMHWYKVMREATTTETFWPASVLFLEVADGRVEAIQDRADIKHESFLRYWKGIERKLENRFDKISSKWKKQLFAEDAPPRHLLYSDEPMN